MSEVLQRLVMLKQSPVQFGSECGKYSTAMLSVVEVKKSSALRCESPDKLCDVNAVSSKVSHRRSIGPQSPVVALFSFVMQMFCNALQGLTITVLR